jgi:hypothetical protein
MEYLILFVFLIVNSVISFLNAYGAGAMYSEAKAIGGWTRVVNVSALIMAACGWSWVILTIETMIVVTTGYLTPEESMAMFNLGWLFLIVPAVGSGFALWGHSFVRAFKTRNWGDAAVAGWNTFAQAHNVYTMAKHAPGAIESVMNVFGKSKYGRKLLAIVLLVVIALGGGVLITVGIARWADKQHAIALTD